MDRFCLADGRHQRVGYPSAALLRTLSARERRTGPRPGDLHHLARARATRRSAAVPAPAPPACGGRRFRVGANVWVLRPRLARHGAVQGPPRQGARGRPRRPPAHHGAARPRALPEELLVTARRHAFALVAALGARGGARGAARAGRPGREGRRRPPGSAVLTTPLTSCSAPAPAPARVDFSRVGTVRLYARIGSTRLAVGRLARFRKPGRKRVSLRLTRPAARLLRAARSRCTFLAPGGLRPRTALPHAAGRKVSFRRKNRSRRSRTTRRVAHAEHPLRGRRHAAVGGGSAPVRTAPPAPAARCS